MLCRTRRWSRASPWSHNPTRGTVTHRHRSLFRLEGHNIHATFMYCFYPSNIVLFLFLPLRYISFGSIHRCYSFITLSLRSSSQLHKDMRDTLKGSHTGFRLFLITCWSGVHTHYETGWAQMSVAAHEDGLWTHLGSVHKLFGVVVVDAVNLQKGIRLAKEVLWREQHDWIVQQQLWD